MSKEAYLPLKYIFLLIIYILHLLFGFLLNDVTGWTIMSGVRIYTKFIPIFLIPLIFPLSEKEFKHLFFFVFILAMAQLPVVLLQRFVFFAGTVSGDPMGGTVGHSASGVLAMFLVIVMVFIIAFYLKEQITFKVFLFTFAAAFLPITLNETKISFILLPLAFILSAFFVKGKVEVIFKIFLLFAFLALSFFVLKGIYNHFQRQRWGYGIETFVTTPGRLEEYNRRRFDPIKYSFTYAAVQDVRFAVFGRGAGNASQGFIEQLEGKYLNERLRFGFSNVTFPKMIWEIGLLGTFLFFLFPFNFALDAIRLSKEPGFLGSFGLGMISYCAFFSLALFYTHTLDSNILLYLFFLTAGYTAHQRKILSDRETSQETGTALLQPENSFRMNQNPTPGRRLKTA